MDLKEGKSPVIYHFKSDAVEGVDINQSFKFTLSSTGIKLVEIRGKPC